MTAPQKSNHNRDMALVLIKHISTLIDAELLYDERKAIEVYTHIRNIADNSIRKMQQYRIVDKFEDADDDEL